jgi:NADPH2 dehydrogenase
MRFPLQVFRAMRAVWPETKPMGMRISAVDWIEGGWSIEDSITLARRLKDIGCDFIDVSSGGIDPAARIPVGPGYQVPFAEQIKKAVGIPVMAVGMITEATQAEAIIAEGRADFVAIARGFLDDPHWGWHAAYRLGAAPKQPPQYRRVGPQAWPPAKRYEASA